MIDIASFIPQELKDMAKLFPEKAPLYVVGGFVRDAIEYNKASLLKAQFLPMKHITELMEHGDLISQNNI